MFKRELEQYGTVLTIGLEEFVSQLSLQPPRIVSAARLTSLIGEVLPDAARPSTGDAVLELVMKGDVCDEIILGSRSTGPAYIVKREAVDRIEAEISRGAQRFFIHSDLGNGKTLLLHDLKLRLLQTNMKVYSLTQYDDMIEADLRSIAQQEGRKVFLVEDFFRHSDMVEKIVHEFPTEVIICTARTSVFDLRNEQVSNVLGEIYREFDVNRLEGSDVAQLIEIVDQNGLWGEFSGKHQRAKVDLIRDICNSELRLFLIKLFESPQFKERLVTYFQSNLNDRMQRWLVAIFFLDIAEFQPDTMIASEVSGIDVFAELQLLRNSTAREFIDLRSGHIKVKSAVLGQYIVQHVFEPEFILSTLVICAKNRESARYGNDVFYDVLKAISKFSFVDRIFLRVRAKDHYIRLYDQLKILPTMSRNPQFWLQYAIARLSNGNYRAAEILFNTSYSHAKERKGYDAFQIDNHYARFLLESRANDSTFGDAFQAFVRAHSLVLSQAKKEKDAYYPYKVAGNYRVFYQKREKDLTPEQRGIVRQAAAAIIREIDAGSARLLRYPAVVEARALLSSLLAEAA